MYPPSMYKRELIEHTVYKSGRKRDLDIVHHFTRIRPAKQYFDVCRRFCRDNEVRTDVFLPRDCCLLAGSSGENLC